MSSPRVDSLIEELSKLSPDEAMLLAELLETKLGVHSPISALIAAGAASAAEPVDSFEMESFLPGDSSTDAPPPEDR